MPITSGMTVVFRVAAGPRLGFGHLVRCRSLARALGVTPRAWVRGSAATRASARAMGVEVLRETTSLRHVGPSPVLVVDDPSAAFAAACVRRAHSDGVPVCAIHDAGRVRVAADLVVDGSVGLTSYRDASRLFGPEYAVLDPGVRAKRRARRTPRSGLVCIALGGGAHVFALVPMLVAALTERAPGVDIRVARGFVARKALPALTSGQWLAPEHLADNLADAEVAIVAGGVTAYEACAVGVPLVAVAVTPAQQPTVRALYDLGAVLDGGLLRDETSARRVAERAAFLLATPSAQRRVAAAAKALIDGEGVCRVAAAIRTLGARGRVKEGASHAA